MKYGLSPIRTPNKDEKNSAGYNNSKKNRKQNNKKKELNGT